jgi:uncharacterized membrane protein
MNARVQSAAFYGLLSLPIVFWALVVLPNYFFDLSPISTGMVYAAVTASPLIGGDVSIFGEVTPMLLAGAIIALIPKPKNGVDVIAIALAVASYVLFIQLSIYFSSGPGMAILYSDWHDNIAEPQKIILKLVANVRVMAIVVAAAILGYNIKGTA